MARHVAHSSAPLANHGQLLRETTLARDVSNPDLLRWNLCVVPGGRRMQARTDYQPCARCPEEAIVGLDSEWLCAICFDEALAAKREQVEAIILSFEEEFGVRHIPAVALGADLEVHFVPPVEVDEIRSPLLCGDDE